MGDREQEEVVEDLVLLLSLSLCRWEQCLAAVGSCLPLPRDRPVHTDSGAVVLSWCSEYNCLIVTCKQHRLTAGNRHGHCLVHLGLLLTIEVLVRDRFKQNTPVTSLSLPVLSAAF